MKLQGFQQATTPTPALSVASDCRRVKQRQGIAARATFMPFKGVFSLAVHGADNALNGAGGRRFVERDALKARGFGFLPIPSPAGGIYLTRVRRGC